MSVFDQAKSLINAPLIEALFPGGEWRGPDDYWLCSPLRSDNSIGSFHIFRADDTWIYKDFSTDDSGDVIDLYAKSTGKSPKDSAEDIIRKAGATPETSAKSSTRSRKKIKPVFPIPMTEEIRLALTNEVRGDWARDHHGEVGGAWKYFDAQGGWVFAVARFNKPDGSKDVIPYFYGEDERWHEGQAMADGRPLYGLPDILAAPESPVLIVEGEKCASVKVPGFIVTTWSGGAGATSKTDFSPLSAYAAEGRVVIWPDADEPGLKAAAAIKNRLPGAQIMDIQGRASGWDIADAVAEGIDLPAFLDTCPRLTSDAPATSPDAETAQFFRCLGYDADRYWFLREGQRVLLSISRGSFNTSRVQDLAPLAFWGALGFIGDQGGIKLAFAQDYLQGIQDRVGRYDPDRLRGAGIWRDGEEIIINDGRRLIRRDGTAQEYAEYPSRFFYLSSDANFGDMTGEVSTDQEGHDLLELFETQVWTRRTQMLAVLGWALLAIFGGILTWRPHIWIIGRKGTGKSYVIEHLIDKLLGAFEYKGTSESTKASIRREVGVDARPVRLDEMEARNKKSAERIDGILELERNSSSDASGFLTICNADGGVDRFKIRSCFCNASVAMPSIDAAITSRIIPCELRWLTPEAMDEKKKRTRELAKRCMKDPGRFRRRIFRALPDILENIEFLRNENVIDFIGDQRQMDQWAPILAAVFALLHGGSMEGEAGAAFVAEWGDELSTYAEDLIEDEDVVIGHILSASIENDNKKRRTVAELLTKADDFTDEGRLECADLLARYGLKIGRHKDKPVLGIACASDAIRGILRDTVYATGYDAQVRRHTLCVNPKENSTWQMAGKSTRCRFLDWDAFKEMYMRKKEGEE